jgi:hypothetical protein
MILAPAQWLRFAPPLVTGLSTVSFGSFRFAPFPKRMPLPSLARAGMIDIPSYYYVAPTGLKVKTSFLFPFSLFPFSFSRFSSIFE